MVAVADEGVLFFDEEFSALTQPFRKGGNHQGNTGLGLSIAKDIVWRHQGSLEIDRDGSGKSIALRLLRARCV